MGGNSQCAHWLIPSGRSPIWKKAGTASLALSHCFRVGVATGRELWSAALPAAGNATPMTYEMNGKQYLVIAAGAHQRLREESLGDSVVAFALP